MCYTLLAVIGNKFQNMVILMLAITAQEEKTHRAINWVLFDLTHRYIKSCKRKAGSILNIMVQGPRTRSRRTIIFKQSTALFSSCNSRARDGSAAHPINYFYISFIYYIIRDHVSALFRKIDTQVSLL
jgi:hypothetical protein